MFCLPRLKLTMRALREFLRWASVSADSATSQGAARSYSADDYDAHDPLSNAILMFPYSQQQDLGIEMSKRIFMAKSQPKHPELDSGPRLNSDGVLVNSKSALLIESAEELSRFIHLCTIKTSSRGHLNVASPCYPSQTPR
jgi:hypothetical protein